MRNRLIQMKPLNPVIGAEIGGVDLSQPLDRRIVGEMREALLDHKVIFFRDQDITPRQHLEFARSFGEPEANPMIRAVDGLPEVNIFENDEANPPDVNVWHIDTSYLQVPAMGSILHCKALPETGGDTAFVNLAAAYDDLSPSMKAFLQTLTAIHDHAHVAFNNVQSEDERAGARRSFPPAEHPVIRTHPETGRCSIFVNESYTTGIKGLAAEEAQAILGFLYEHCRKMEYMCRFTWRRNSIAFWDNRATMHYALADYWPHHRCMYRVTLKGERPYFKA